MDPFVRVHFYFLFELLLLLIIFLVGCAAAAAGACAAYSISTEAVTVYRLPIRLPATSALTWPVV